jgi:hypothetical protein
MAHIGVGSNRWQLADVVLADVSVRPRAGPFAPGLDQDSTTLAQGEAATTTIRLLSANQGATARTLSIGVLPPGVSAAVTPNVIIGPGSPTVTLTLTTSRTTPPADYQVVIGTVAPPGQPAPTVVFEMTVTGLPSPGTD